ncbi:hypothetical protein CO009_01380 [Candidatus Shapirobacteria bacterium CG_4_8_14_3_um_filter_35_11]|uniref:Methyltransferase type 11 domain-containing protein n=6 Tax=Candidatus Shapironibacteriota TaxID=1752721 RepID=A0A1J5HSD9_9BACT|nr:MAG: hypothetical protein AUK05_00630 [Candidatus Shapirobacteria bacterium CG2_30_35_20]PIV07796.1 MAG: hypothetical protein COS53_00505 [Candidatus Shapirobacteria bacterium CG03_land_8_20_14_0_80_35_14]PIX68007.1 MAG: hypothetical protein COZ41_01955 [Candidatus Shapirobacteria bacterium CG_4_10_14_3_um_filter_35_13]PJA51391.1 MAG: hypothetical protein CO168_00040 [Candidatus Shapirobacteria bacterium CG_4_9_14_3_um_filter_36_12]PJC80679.1 MAG: hypothetical protein CO009_01380 [Candidatus
MVNINLGSGPFSAVGWINFDYGLLPLLGKLNLTGLVSRLGLLDKSYVIKWPKIRYFDIRRSLPLKSDTVDNIYCSNVLEHFEKYEAEKILRECRRVLGRKGLLRVVLPDIRKLMVNYKNSNEFCQEFYGYDKDVSKFSNIFIRGHQWMYDVEMFVKLLLKCGFTKVNVVTYKQGNCPDIDVLDLPIHERLCFYVEATA